MNSRFLIFFSLICTTMLIVTVTEPVCASQPTFEGDPAACAWYTDLTLENMYITPFHSGYIAGIATYISRPRGFGIYDTVDLFVRANDDGLLHYHLIPGSYRPGSPGFIETVLPNSVKIYSSPAAVQRGPNSIDVFAKRNDGRLWHLAWDGNAWSEVEAIDRPPVDWNEVAVCSWGPDRIDLFVDTSSGDIQHKSLNHETWSSWENIGTPPGGATSAPAAGSWGPNRVDVVVRGGNNAYYRKWYDLGGWLPNWQEITGGIFSSSPAVSQIPLFPGARGSQSIGIDGRGMDRSIYGMGYLLDGTNSGWSSIGGILTSAPTFVNYLGDHVTVFAKGQDNTMWYCDYDLGQYEEPSDFVWARVGDLPVRESPQPLIEAEPARPTEPGTPPVLLPKIIPDNNTDLPGSDYKSFDLKEANPNVCAQACSDDPQCKAFVYGKPEYQGPNAPARCWLKNDVPNPVKAECCISGVIEGRSVI